MLKIHLYLVSQINCCWKENEVNWIQPLWFLHKNWHANLQFDAFRIDKTGENFVLITGTITDKGLLRTSINEVEREWL